MSMSSFSPSTSCRPLKVIDQLRGSTQVLRRLESQHLLLTTDKEMEEMEARIASAQKDIEAGLKAL